MQTLLISRLVMDWVGSGDLRVRFTLASLLGNGARPGDALRGSGRGL